MQLERRALYNSLRIHWLNNPTIAVEDWQILDYRSLTLSELFANLERFGLKFDRVSLISIASPYDTPEDLTEVFLEEQHLDHKYHDPLYLIIFELWRRLLPEKRSLSIICDELDYLINLYDHGELKSLESLEDGISSLQQILDENGDEGASRSEVFDTVNLGCANDLESFLYDFIADRIDAKNLQYASELLEAFIDCVEDRRWFEFLLARLTMPSEPDEANKMLEKIIRKAPQKPDLIFNLELLAFLVQDGEKDLFPRLAKQTINLLETEEDFQDLLNLSANYYHCLDKDSVENVIRNIHKNRPQNSVKASLNPLDSDLKSLKQILNDK
jgi:tetratricopeptide (TPR) repeat protein